MTDENAFVVIVYLLFVKMALLITEHQDDQVILANDDTQRSVKVDRVVNTITARNLSLGQDFLD